MKKNDVNRMKARIFLLLTSLLLISSCSNDNAPDNGYVPKDQIPNTGAPVITGVYDAADKSMTKPLTEGEPGQNLLIVGANLNALKSLKFNTIEADLAQTYTMSTQAIVQVPLTYCHERVNTIEYTTDKGTVAYTFYVALPKMQVKSLDNEFQAEGQLLTISGENFDYYGFGESSSPAKVEVGGRSVAVTEVSATELTIKVPEGTGDNTSVAVSWQDYYGEMQQVALPFRPSSRLLFVDMSKAQRDRTDECVTIENDSQVSSTVSQLGTPHLHFIGDIRKYAWIELSFTQNQPDLGDLSKLEEYNFVFEVLTEVDCPLAGNGYEFAWNWNWNISYVWNPGDGKGWDTEGEWFTVRLPLEKVAPAGIGKTGELMTLNIGFQPAEKYHADFRMGNFRIQKK